MPKKKEPRWVDIDEFISEDEARYNYSFVPKTYITQCSSLFNYGRAIAIKDYTDQDFDSLHFSVPSV